MMRGTGSPVFSKLVRMFPYVASASIQYNTVFYSGKIAAKNDISRLNIYSDSKCFDGAATLGIAQA